MKKKLLSLLAFTLAMGVSSTASAAVEGFIEKTDFLESFTNVSNVKNIGLGWNYQAGIPEKAPSISSSNAISGKYVSYTSAYATTDVTKNTLIITPQIKGTIEFKAKPASNTAYSVTNYLNTNKSYVRLFAGSMVEGVLTFSDTPFFEHFFTELPDDEKLDSNYWVALSTSLSDYAYVGIQLSCAGFDEISAPYVLIPENRVLTPVKVESDFSDNNPIFADMSGNGTWEGAITVRNDGNIILKKGEENFSLTVASNSTAVTTTMTSFAIPQDLEIGEEATFEVSVPISLVDVTVDGRSAIRFTTNMMAPGTTATTSANYKQSTWFTLKTVAPKLFVKNAKDENVENYATDLGLVAAPASTTFTFRNDGGSAIVLKSIESSFVNATWKEGETAVTFPLQIAKGASKVLTLVLNNTGGQSSTLTFNYGNTYNAVEYQLVSKAVSAVVSDPSLYLEDFDSYLTVPTGWCQPGWLNQEGSNWSFNSSSSNTYATNATQAYPDACLVTPKLTFTAGQTLTVAAQPKSSPYGSDCYIKVLYSSDRKSWSVAGYIGYVNDSGEATKSSAEGINASLVHGWSVSSGNGNLSSSYCKPYVIDGIPAGDWYIGFQSGYSIIDYIFGGVLIELDHDLYVSSYEVPSKATVNYPVTVSLAYNNMLNKAESAYTVDIYNGETKLTTINKEGLAAYADDQVEYEFYPHAVGSLSLQAKINIGSNPYTTDVVSIPVVAEVATADQLVGTRTSSTGSVVPFSLNWYNSMSEFIYTADMLDMTEGTKITSLTFPYYNTSKDITSKVRFYLANVEDAKPGTAFSDTTQMQCVFDDAAYVFKMAGTSSDHALMKFELDEEFVYTGKNIRVVCVSEQAGAYTGYNFEYTNVSNSAIYKRNDTYSTYQSTQTVSATSNLPVVYFGYVVDTPEISGVLKNGADNSVIADANIRFSCGNVWYEDTTDAEGNYSVTIMQPSREYQITVDPIAANLYQYPIADLTFSTDATLDVVLPSSKYTRNVVEGNFGTLCLPNAIPAGYVLNADVYSIAGVVKNGEAIDCVVLAQETAALEAGKPYLFVSNDETIEVYGIGTAVAQPVAATGMVGTFAEETLTTEGMYIMSNNQLRKLAGGAATIGANRAYFDLASVSEYNASESNGLHIVTIDVEEEGNVTALSDLATETHTEVYDLMGRRVEAPAKGFFIVGGKKAVVK